MFLWREFSRSVRFSDAGSGSVFVEKGLALLEEFTLLCAYICMYVVKNTKLESSLQGFLLHNYHFS